MNTGEEIQEETCPCTRRKTETRKAVRAAKEYGFNRRPWKQREEGIAASLCKAVSGPFSEEGKAWFLYSDLC